MIHTVLLTMPDSLEAARVWDERAKCIPSQRAGYLQIISNERWDGGLGGIACSSSVVTRGRRYSSE